MASQFGEGDLGIVNYALTLEYLEAAFYDDVAKSGLFKGDDLALIEEIGETEQEHVDALDGDGEAARRQPAAEAPKTKFPLDDADVGAEAGGDRREPRRRRLPRPGGEHRDARHPRRRALDPHGRGPPRGGAQHADRPAADPGRRLRAGAPTCRPSWTRSSRSSSSDDGREKGKKDDKQTDAAPELAKIEVEDLDRSTFLMRGVLAAGAALRHARGHAARPQGVRAGRRWATSTSSTTPSRSSTSRPRSTRAPRRRRA